MSSKWGLKMSAICAEIILFPFHQIKLMSNKPESQVIDFVLPSVSQTVATLKLIKVVKWPICSIDYWSFGTRMNGDTQLTLHMYVGVDARVKKQRF